jgi:hypothetical protein
MPVPVGRQMFTVMPSGFTQDVLEDVAELLGVMIDRQVYVRGIQYSSEPSGTMDLTVNYIIAGPRKDYV